MTTATAVTTAVKTAATTDVTLQQLCAAIVAYNHLFAGEPMPPGGKQIEVASLYAGMGPLSAPESEWHRVAAGAFAGCRYLKTPHGLVVRAATGSVSLIPESMARTVGILP